MGPEHGGSERPAADQIATVICRLTEAYLGDAYKSKCGCSNMRWLWRWFNATFGTVTFFSAVLIITLLAPAQKADAELSQADTELSRLSVLLDTPIAIGFSVLGFSMLLSCVTAKSIQRGGPLRLFISGVIIPSLAFLMAGRML